MKRMARLFAVLCSTVLCAMAAPPLNVVVIVADDMGWGDLSVHGNRNIRTPNLDGLARDGARFDRFYVSPVCSPTRASLLTGRYPGRTGVRDVTRGGEWLNLDETTIADLFRAAGFATGAFGKWHNGSAYPYHPNGRGFDVFDGFCCGHWPEYFDPMLERNGIASRRKGYISDILTDSAIAFVEENRARPFLCYLAYNTPHSPFEVPDADHRALAERALVDLAGPGEDPLVTRAALAMVENMDRNIGRLLDRLDQLKLADHTAVVFLSDNGPNSRRWNGGLRGIKGSVDEGGTRSPCIVRLPGVVRGGARIAQPAAAIDLLPTLCELASVPARTTKPLDGRSLVPLLTGATNWLDRPILTAWNGRASVRNGVYWDDGKSLYDLTSDPGQRHDLIDERPAVHKELAAARANLLREMNVNPAPRPIPVGFSSFPQALLPAQEAQLSAALALSSRHPNASWIDKWSCEAATAGWRVSANTTGLYTAEVLYTCNAAATGACFSLSAGPVTWTGAVTQVWNPPLRPALDRVPRTESFAKEFHAVSLGTRQLEKGDRAIALTLSHMPRGACLDVMGVRLTLEPAAAKP